MAQFRTGRGRREFLQGLALGTAGLGSSWTALAPREGEAQEIGVPGEGFSIQSRESVRAIAEWAFSVRYEDLPRRVIAKAKYQLLNTLAAIYGGHTYSPSRKVLELVGEWSAQGQSTVLPMGFKTSAPHAVFANAALSITHDFDDYLFLGHTGHSAVSVPLAVGEELDRDLKDVLVAQVVANEVAGRLGASILFGKMNGQLWSPIHAAGAAVAAGKLMGLSVPELQNALGLAMYQPPWGQWPGFLSPDSKLLTAAQPAMAGVMAAQLAAKGLAGSPVILDHRQGFVRNFSCLPMPFMLSGWGRSWVTDTLTYKIHPGDAYVSSVLDALMRILDEYESRYGTRRIPPDRIRRVEIRVGALSWATEQLAVEYTNPNRLVPINVNFSLLLSLALAFVAGRLTTDELSFEYLEAHRSEILGLRQKMVLQHDLAKTADLFATVQQTIDIWKALAQFTPGELLKGLASLHEFYGFDLGGFFGISSPGSLSGQLPIGGLGGPFDLGDYNLDALRMPFGADVKLVLTDGRIFRQGQRIPLGAPGSESLEARFRRVEAKFWFEAGRLLSRDRIDAVIAATRRLENFGRVRDFMNLAAVG